MDTRKRLIVALDVDTKDRALAAVKKLKGEVNFFKIGLELFSSCGPSIVEEVRAEGVDVFLDLKLHDIPTTVAKAAVAVTKLGANIINVHALGCYEMMQKAAAAVREAAKVQSIASPKIIAVTILTSMDDAALAAVGIAGPVATAVEKLALLAKKAGLDGVVASPLETKKLRQALGPDALIVTPGVRPVWAATNDQKRITTPRDAFLAGASHIVVGRPILDAADPVDAVRKIIQEIRT